MKRIFIKTFMLVLFLYLPLQAHALIIDMPDVNGKGYFKDTSTGKLWMDLDNFFGQSYNSVDAYLEQSLYHIATLTEIQELAASVDPYQYETLYPILGGYRYIGSSYTSYSFSGFYNDGDPLPRTGLAYFTYSGSSGSVNPWYFSNDYCPPTVGANSGGSSTWSVWVTSDNKGLTTPEPVTLLLFGTGLIGLTFKKNNKNIRRLI